MKKAWQVLVKDWPTMGFLQKFGWIICFPPLFLILWFAVEHGAKLEEANRRNRETLAKRRKARK